MIRIIVLSLLWRILKNKVNVINPDLNWDYYGIISRLNFQHKIEIKDIGIICHISEKSLNWAMVFKIVNFSWIYRYGTGMRIWDI